MKTQTPVIDRRQYSREGVVGEIENLTYKLLRKYGITGHADQYDIAEDAEAAYLKVGCCQAESRVFADAIRDAESQDPDSGLLSPESYSFSALQY